MPSIRALAAILALVAYGAAGQASPQSTLCVLPPSDLSPEVNEAAEEVASAVVGIVGNSARASGFGLVPEAEWSTGAQGTSRRDFVRGPVALRVAAAAAADYVVTGHVRAEGSRIVVQLKAYQVADKRLIAAVSARARTGLAVYSAAQPAIDRLIAALREPLPELLARGRPEAGTALITLVSPDEGARIFLAGEEPAGTVTAGAVSFEAPAGRPVDVEVRKPGYHSRRLIVSSEAEQDLPALVAETRWAVGPLLTAGRLPGLGIAARRYLRPDQIYVGLEEFIYRPAEEDPAAPGYRADTRIDIGVHVPQRPHAQARVGLSAGVGLELLRLLDDGPPLFDLYVNALTVSGEINAPAWTGFIRAEARYSLPVSDEPWAGEWRSIEGGAPPVTVGILRKIR